MGKMAATVFEGTKYTLSLVEWGRARKLQYADLKKLGATNEYEHPNFVPACEVAIYDTGPDDLLSDPAKLGKPSLIFYYSSLALAEEKMGHLAELVRRGGDCGKPMREYIEGGDPSNEFAWTPPFSQFLDDITEEWGGELGQCDDLAWDSGEGVGLKGIAITREPSASYYKCCLEFNERREIDVDLTRRQHRGYVDALRECGMQVVVLPAVDAFPDCCFVEDTAVVLDDAALITNMGAESRNGEQRHVAECLAQWCELFYMQPPATLEGGDVLRVDKTIFVGRSRRTNEAGIKALEELAIPRGYQVHRVAVGEYLHLKTAVTYVGEGTLIATRQMEQNLREVVDKRSYEIETVPDGCEYAANALFVNGKVLLPAGYPQVIDSLRGRGVSVKEVQMSEFQKGEGGLTCLSIIL